MKNTAAPPVSDFNTELNLRGFNVYEVRRDCSVPLNYSRKDFYKICLSTGTNIIEYADKSFKTESSILFFGNPRIPYSWEIVSADYSGYACLFTEDFLKTGDRYENIQDSPLFKIGGNPIFNLNEEQRAFIATLFQKMIAEQATTYVHKTDLLRNYVNLIIHEALKMQPSENLIKHTNASSRIASLFLELLERQFPIESTERPLQLKTAQDYAKGLAIHVNHLNRSVKEVVGKSTSTIIAERIITEARALLQHTNWSISEIAFSLGFEYPTYFNNYFKRLTGTVPSALRTQIV